MKRGSLIYFILNVLLTSAQVDEFKMRQQIISHQLKEQEMGASTQRGTILAKSGDLNLSSTSCISLLKTYTDLYLTDHGNFVHGAYFRNRVLRSNLSINNVDFSSSILENNLQMLEFQELRNFDKVECLYGNSISKSFQEAQITLLNSRFLEPNSNKDSTVNPNLKTENHFQLQYNSNYLKGGISHYLDFKRIKNQLGLFGNYSNRYTIGTSSRKDNWGFLPQVHNGSTNPYAAAWILNSDSSQYKFQNYFLGIQNLTCLDLNHANQLSLFFQVTSASYIDLGKLNQKNGNYLISESNSELKPLILAYLQYIKKSDEAKLYSQFNIAISFLHANLRTDNRYQVLDSRFRQHYDESKMAVQLTAYKNLNPRNVFYYGSQASISSIQSKAPLSENFINQYNGPNVDLKTYFRHEYRPNSDVSFFYGGQLGLSTYSLLTMPYSSIDQVRTFPNAQVNLSWTRHTCESSNYSVNLFIKLKNPSLHDIRPAFSEVYFKPNFDLKAEKEIILESNLYRKLNDRLEIHISPYFRSTWDAILLADNIGDAQETVSYQNSKYFTIQNQNLERLNEFGVQTELKYHWHRSLLFFGSMNYNSILSQLPVNMTATNIPFHGSIGIKFHLPKFSAQVWSQYNAGVTNSRTIESRYLAQYSNPDIIAYTFPSFFIHNASMKLQVHRRIDIGLNIENILDANYRSYLSTMHGLGRNISFQVNLLP